MARNTYPRYHVTRPWLTLMHTDSGPHVDRWDTHENVISLLVRFAYLGHSVNVSVWRKAGKGWRAVGPVNL